jgi:hypothetical protein
MDTTRIPAKALVFGAIGLLVFLLILTFSGSAGTVNQGNKDAIPQPDDIVAVVGEENIYPIDLENQRKLYTGDTSVIPDAEGINAIAQDSVILQGGQADGLIRLDDSFYNSPNKNYITRLKQVAAIIRFEAFQGEPITISKELDQALWNSSPNEV